MTKYRLTVYGNGAFPNGTIYIEDDVHILQALEDAGYDVPYSSMVGGDAVTAFMLLSGSVDSSEGFFVEDELRESGVFEGDVTYVKSDSSIYFLGEEGYNELLTTIAGDGATILPPIIVNGDSDGIDSGGSGNIGDSGNSSGGGSGGTASYTDVLEKMGVLFSPGIDLTDGIMLIKPNTEKIPSFVIPARSGMEAYSSDSMFYHSYEFSASVSLDGYEALQNNKKCLEALERALISNPTPGNDGPASINGTINDAGNLVPFDGDDNLVYSFVVDNKNPDQSDIIVNYTIGGEHVLASGYVGRMVQRSDHTPDNLTDAHYSYSLITFGEGDAFLQGAFEWPAEYMAESAWYQNSLEIFGAANEWLQ
ncbi:hypothetical protein H4S14_000303 [Agrobacterium vitis]|nr:hypothetical protein [Agrobacterium vitis]MBE1436576.1 hypothetical protein [Agrobacterium vitis]